MPAANLKTKQRTLDYIFVAATELEMKALGDDKPEGFIAGWASTPSLDSYRDVVKTGAFDEAIARRTLTGPKGIRLLIGHDWAKVAGKITKLETRNKKLWIEAELELGIGYVKDYYLATKASGGMNFSVGFMIQDYSYKKDAEDIVYLEITRGDLFEVSAVPFPGNEECTMEFVKSVIKEIEEPDATASKDADIDFDKPCESLPEFEKRLIAAGLVKDRNAARLITLEVKSALSIFSKTTRSDAPDATTEQAPEPLVAKDSLDQFSEMIAKTKALLTSS